MRTRRSAVCTIPLLSRVCRESYSQPPADVDERLKRRGMDLRRGLGRMRGETGGDVKFIRDLCGIGRRMVASKPWTAPVTLLGVAVPMATLGNYGVESVFARWWMSRYLKVGALRVANPAAGPVAEAA